MFIWGSIVQLHKKEQLMICPSCNNGILSPSLPKPILLTYRSFNKSVGVSTSIECSSCLYEAKDSLKANVNIDQEMILFKREVNTKLSEGEV